MRAGTEKIHELVDQLNPGDHGAAERLLKSLTLPPKPPIDWNHEIQKGIASYRNEGGFDAEDVFERIDQELAAEERNERH